MRANTETNEFERLYTAYSADVFRFLLYLTGNWELAQDLASETFVRAWTTDVPIRTETAKAYLFTIARNLYTAHLRAFRGEVPDDSDLSIPAAQASGLEARDELAHTLRDLNRIAEGDRAAFVMAVFEELGYEEVARALGITAGAVKARVFRARLRLTELRQQRESRSSK
ncbi:MAG: RNA polymerase sigma factor [Acidobacteria bacterium]|nr:RNA polymerase sigma factor [Acidobacteriota bacterium]